MSDAPGILAVWNDRDSKIATFYEDWYINQHLPERVGLPGWRFGRRYEALGNTTPQFFTYYETDSVAAMFSEHYVARLNDPTPETRQVMQHWRNMTRTSCALSSARGKCRGAYVVVAYVYDSDVTDRLEQIAVRAIAETGALSVQVWSNQTISEVRTAEADVRSSSDRVISAAIVLDLMRQTEVQSTSTWLAAALPALDDCVLGNYQLLCELRADA